MDLNLLDKKKEDQEKQTRKYAKMRNVLKSQISHYGFPIFFNSNPDDDLSNLDDIEDALIDKVIEFAKSREDLILSKNEWLRLEDISSECYIRPTKDMQSFAIVKVHMVADPTILNIYAFSVIKWNNDFHLLQIGKLSAKTKGITYDGSMKTIANISWIDTVESKLQKYEDDYTFATNSRDRNNAVRNMSTFTHKVHLIAENKGVGRALLDTFDSIARRIKIDYAILESVPRIADLVDYDGNVVQNEKILTDKDGIVIHGDAEPVQVDLNTDIFYSRQGFIKIGMQSRSGGEYMYKPYRPAYSSATPENLKLMFESFDYNTTSEQSDNMLDFDENFIPPIIFKNQRK